MTEMPAIRSVRLCMAASEWMRISPRVFLFFLFILMETALPQAWWSGPASRAPWAFRIGGSYRRFITREVLSGRFRREITFLFGRHCMALSCRKFVCSFSALGVAQRRIASPFQTKFFEQMTMKTRPGLSTCLEHRYNEIIYSGIKLGVL